jgi:hypothetical protein
MGYGRSKYYGQIFKIKNYETNFHSCFRRPRYVVLFAGLVYAVLVAAHISEPAAATVYGFTFRRLWATTVVMLALVGVVVGGLALRRSIGHIGTCNRRRGAIVALAAGLIAVVNGGLNLAIANGGPGTGNGVIGGAAALVLGLIAMILGRLALVRSRRLNPNSQPER